VGEGLMDSFLHVLNNGNKGTERETKHPAYYMSLRIFGNIDNFDEITNLLKLNPTYIRKKGELKPWSKDKIWENDMWCYGTNIPVEKSLEEHLNSLWDSIKISKNEILKLQERYKADIFIHYESNNCIPCIEIPYTSLEMLIDLKLAMKIYYAKGDNIEKL
jgi:hypothetical protein